MSAVASVLGGLGLFLLGMSMMTEGLKLSAGAALRSILERWTKSAIRGFAAGVLITAIMQASGAVIVMMIGFVNAGLLNLSQAIWVIFGANIGTTTTGWLVALVGVKVDVGLLALPLLGAGMLLRLAAGSHVARAGAGQALAGFGTFFLGVNVLQEGFAGLAPMLGDLQFDQAGPLTVVAFVGLGTVLTILAQSSSAVIAIVLTASAGGVVPLELAAATVIGTNIGTTSTALFASIGATPPARRVAASHVAFNLLATLIALAAFPLLLGASRIAADAFGASGDMPATLAIFHTVFNSVGLLALWPLAGRLTRLLSRLFVSEDENLGRPRNLDDTILAVPAIALRGLVLEIGRLAELAFDLAKRRIGGGPTQRLALYRREAGVLLLGREIRGYVDKLGAQSLPAEVVDALPDLVRAIQHLEDVAETSGLLTDNVPLPGGTDEQGHWAQLEAIVADSLDMMGGSAAGGGAEKFHQLLERKEEAYEVIKADLLRATARGVLPVARMETALERARLLRRLADSAIKARRRYHPWTALIEDSAVGNPSAGQDAAERDAQ